MFSVDDRRMVSQVHNGSSAYMSADLYWYRAGGRLQRRWWESLNCDGRTSVLRLSLNLSHSSRSWAAASSGGNGLASSPFNPVQTDEIVQKILQRGFAHTPEPGALEVAQDTCIQREAYVAMYGPTYD